jgi:hypothetical protein
MGIVGVFRIIAIQVSGPLLQTSSLLPITNKFG